MTTLLIFLKAPRMGQVKTRLAQTLGPQAALEAYCTLVARQWTALPRNAQVEVYYAPRDAIVEMEAWLGAGPAYYPQAEGDLGARLRHAVDTAFERGAHTVACLGGDCPLLEQRHFDQAEKLLVSGHDVVFGPSEDGGYYLIALRKPTPELFTDIPWSTQTTLEASLTKAESLGLKVGLLETLYDVDEVDEWERALADGLIQFSES